MKVTLCGSTRFRDRFNELNKKFSKQGHIVHSVASFGHHENDMTEEDKETLDLVHLQKIINSDAIFVIVGPTDDAEPYIGSSLKKEIKWAKMTGRRIFYSETEFQRCVGL